MPFLIRQTEATDEPAWRRLWAGYLDFYEADVAADVTDATWARSLSPGSGIFGRVAVARDGTLAGFSLSILHPGTWRKEPLCYLEDLFVDPQWRSQGVGRLLIEDLVRLGKENGWATLYWHTQATNGAARRLYDQFIQADGFVRYRLSL
ncbi:MAG: GNAT family N-acetyltransferase [Hyphomicrobium sp.]|jgi:ribosomal protein S18 acetylase RimI-like enzyme